MDKEWKQIEGYENYRISNHGEIVNIDGIVMRFNLDRYGYYKLSLSRKSTRKNFYVHRLVGIHFVENPENKPEVNHDDGIKTNNCYTNLTWMTSSENQKHAYLIGLQKRQQGESRYNSKLTNENVRHIRNNPKNKTQKYLAYKFSITQSIISGIINNKRWNHVN